MTRLLKLPVFGGLAVGLHLVAFIGARPEGGAASSGDGGADLVAVAAAPAAYAAMARAWEIPPEIAQTPEKLAAPTAPAAPPTPQQSAQIAVPRMAMPALALAGAPSMPKMDMEAPKRPEPEKPKVVQKPPRAKPSAPSRLAAAQRAAGAGGGATAGERQSAQAATLSKSRQSAVMAQWGAAIRARIDRAKRAPRGAGEGVVTLSVRVASDGGLAAVSVRRSSGNAALDSAALAAVKRARRFPAAPKGLSGNSFGFTLKVRFSG